MRESPLGTSPGEKPVDDRLDSWKEIAAYLKRDVTTVQRWEKRGGMPVHRHLHDKRGSVYALSSELDAWQQPRRPQMDEEEAEQERAVEKEQQREQRFEASPGTAGEPEQEAAPRTRRWVAVATSMALIGLLAATYALFRNRSEEKTRPK